MARITLTNKDVDASFVKESQEDIETKCISIETVVNNIINNYAIDLDNLVNKISKEIKETGLDGLSDNQLENYCLNLSSIMYFAGAGQELIGLREDMANAIFKEKYNEEYGKSTGTMADKKAAAELNTQDKMLIDMIYKHAQKIMESKLIYAVHLLSSIKRVLNRRVEQMKMNPVSISYKDNTK